jgi:hypothetical protein
MNNAGRFQVSTCCNNGFPGRQSSLPGNNFFTFGKNSRTACPMNSAIDASTTHQAGIRRIDNGIRCLFRNISLNNHYSGSIDCYFNRLSHVHFP